ncbi:hypothetical protein MMC31_001465 [Peltigera leucophlebia]|nr:hypothetical protein [Peltigera leucophlebia]
MLDALSLKQLTHSPIEVAENLSEEFTFEKNEVIDAQIERIQKSFKKTHIPAEAAHFHLPTLGHSFLESHKISPKTGYQLIIQLTSLLHFGQQFPSWEVLTLMPFHKGRLDWMQVGSPAMLAFCRAAAAAISNADNKTTPSELRMLLREAAMVHVRTMTRIARGRGFAAHMEALHEIVAQVLPDDDNLLALFRDQTWEKIIRVTNMRKIKTDELGGMMESIFVHDEIEDEDGQFHIRTGSSQDCGTERLCRALDEAAGMFKRVLDI